ncbi:hypothetical protein R70723_23100 [Paenibacillus sp. FSL R7-0273]|uniref:hypothetical protein n=1 Tax=Paenibacillus sp. FSL R7-0273 TaxID=1536772 RepID=UPI0004F7B09B|nr:hypothetical protein [Paenibacillus sp. FSL R7-0273]AIQ48479.1 hypothetical protein R70723_23100 [Paenibacillus sp. FSL R7-0273]OMF86308.1 hypothetical protein BK144_26295 [Paenibacillus sp. FSL R7-0273]
MNEPMENEQLLKEYFNAPVAAPAQLVAGTLRRINDSQPIGILISAAALNIIVALILGVFLLASPLFVFWKIVILLVFALFEVIAAILLVYNVSGGSLEASVN